jgi:hypothetical protein
MGLGALDSSTEVEFLRVPFGGGMLVKIFLDRFSPTSCRIFIDFSRLLVLTVFLGCLD